MLQLLCTYFSNHPDIQRSVLVTFLSLDHLQSQMTVPEIAIIGSGPCGLTLARLLQCKGTDYVVSEREL